MVLDKLNYDQLKIGSYLLLLLITFIFLIIFKRVTSRPYGISFLLSHSSLVLIITAIAISYKDEAQTPLLWLIIMQLDFAVSWLFRITRCWSFFYDSVIMWPCIFFAILGGFQYYILGTLIDYFVKSRE